MSNKKLVQSGKFEISKQQIAELKKRNQRIKKKHRPYRKRFSTRGREFRTH